MAVLMTNKFDPNWCMSPGVTIVEILIHRLAQDFGIEPEEFVEIIAGRTKMDTRYIRLLAANFGLSKEFFENSQRHYLERKEAGKHDVTRDQFLSVLGVEPENLEDMAARLVGNGHTDLYFVSAPGADTNPVVAVFSSSEEAAEFASLHAYLIEDKDGCVEELHDYRSPAWSHL